MKYANIFFLLVLMNIGASCAQKNVKTFEFKKGEVLDIILLSQVENSEALFDRYKKTAFPVAFEYTYQPQPGFRIGALTLGTGTPSSFIFGKWSSLEKREGFLKNIVARVPDFHQQRRDIFPYFGLTYYEMNEDLKFSVDTTKFNVATALWNDPSKTNPSFLNTWTKAVAEYGGKVIVSLTNGSSPLGYYYNADALYLVEWQNKEAFQRFAENHPLSFYEPLRNVHQFVIQ